MKIITLLNEKGGVGKTTLSIHLAAGLAIRGARVLLIDTDAQGHSGYALGQKEFGGLYRLLVQDFEWRDVLRVVAPGTWAGDYPAEGLLHLLPSNVETRAIPMMVSDVTLLRERLDDVRDHYDAVVIDTSPTPSLLHSMIYLATDYLIYPSQCEAMSLEALSKSLFHMQKLKATREQMAGGESVKLLGVQPTMYDARTNAHRYALDLIEQHFGGLTWEPISSRTVWRDAAFASKTVFAYAPGHDAEMEAWGMVDRVGAIYG